MAVPLQENIRFILTLITSTLSTVGSLLLLSAVIFLRWNRRNEKIRERQSQFSSVIGDELNSIKNLETEVLIHSHESSKSNSEHVEVKKVFKLVPMTLVGHLAFADLGNSVATLFVPPNSALCYLQATMLQFFFLASFLLTSCFATSIYRRLISQKSDKHLQKYYLSISWGIPLISVIILFSVHGFGQTTLWCWIAPTAEWYRLGLFYAPLVMCMIYNIVIFVNVYRVAKSKKGMRKLVFFPLIIIVCWIWAILDRIFEAFSSTVTWISILHSCFSPLQGFLDAVIYGLSTSDIAALRHKLKPKKIKETPEEPKRFSTATIINIFCFILFILIRGTINLIISYGTEVAPPLSLLWVRSIPSVIVLGLMVIILSWKTEKFREGVKMCANRWILLKLLIMGVLNFVVPFLVYSYADKHIQVGAASILMSTTPLFVLLFSQYYVRKAKNPSPKDRITRMRLGGIFVGFFGVVAICIVSTLSEGNSNLGSFEYYALFLVGVICQGLALVFWKNHKNLDAKDPKKGEVHWIVGNLGQNATGVIFGLILGLLIDFQWPSAPFPKHYAWLPTIGTWQGLLVVGWLSIASGVIGFMCYFFLVARIGELTAAATYGFPVVGLIEGIIFKKDWEGVSWLYRSLEIVGAVLVIIGLFMCTHTPKTPASKNK